MAGRAKATLPSLVSVLWFWPWISFRGSLLPQTADVRLRMGTPDLADYFETALLSRPFRNRIVVTTKFTLMRL